MVESSVKELVYHKAWHSEDRESWCTCSYNKINLIN